MWNFFNYFLGGTMFLKFENCPSLAWFTFMKFSRDFIALNSRPIIITIKKQASDL